MFIYAEDVDMSGASDASSVWLDVSTELCVAHVDTYIASRIKYTTLVVYIDMYWNSSKHWKHLIVFA